MEPIEMAERLAAFIREQTGAASVAIDNLKRMPGGASREIWSFDATINDSARRDPPRARAAARSRRPANRHQPSQ